MAGRVAIGFSFFVFGDGTTNPVTVDLRTDPVALFYPQPIVEDTNAFNPLTSLTVDKFDIFKNPPTGVVLGSFVTSGASVGFTSSPTGDFTSSPTLSGFKITVTPNFAFTNLQQCIGILLFD